MYLSGPVSYRDFWETGARCLNKGESSQRSRNTEELLRLHDFSVEKKEKEKDVLEKKPLAEALNLTS